MPIRTADGVLSLWFGTNTDVTEMRDAEKRIELLLAEVNHRSKNMLAVVQSLAGRTAAQGGNFIERLEQRIHAMAVNQDLLVNRFWASVPVREMVDAQLGFLGESISQVDREGPEILLAPGAAESLAMAIHEMATNALKFGALSVPSGRVEIAWGIEGDGDERQFRISWRERGGPEVKPPKSTGFGSRIIKDVPSAKLRGEAKLEFASEGFCWRFSCPARNVGG
jgi:two-component sensor histidine kinase